MDGARRFVKVLALGDCNTSGSVRLAPGENLPAQFCRLLSDRGVEVRLINLGTAMSTSREGLARLQAEGLKESPDLVLINFGLVDAWVTTVPSVYVPYYPDGWWRRRWRKLLKSCKRRLRSRWLKRFVPWGEVVPLPEYRRNLVNMIAAVRGVVPGARIVVWGTFPTRDDPVRNANLVRYDACLQALCQAERALYVNTREPFAAIEDPGRMYLDNVHLSAYGSRLVAEWIYRRWVDER